jgi:23S rRNA pseudouridine1911/1915/1917 synthase
LSPEALVVSSADDGTRLDRWLARAMPAVSRGGVRRLMRAGKVRVNGRVQRTGAPVHAGDRIECLEFASEAPVVPEPDLPLRVVHEDARCVIVDKPAGMHTHPQRAGERGTLANSLLARYPEMVAFGHSPFEPGIVHRLDRDTSGLVLAARTRGAFDDLCTALRTGAIVKRYQALCAGRVQAPQVLRAHLRAEGARVAVRAEPFERSRTVELTVESSEPVEAASRVVVCVGAAARHQIRAQMAHAGHPVVGDRPYGGPVPAGLDRHLLHAAEIDLGHGLVVRAYQDDFGAAWG